MEKKYTQEEVDKLIEAAVRETASREAAAREELEAAAHEAAAIRESILHEELEVAREAVEVAVNPYVYILRPYSSCRSEFLYLTTNYKYF